jgi:hypothetical protein
MVFTKNGLRTAGHPAISLCFSLSTSSVPDAVLPAVGEMRSPSPSVSEASSATVLQITPKKKHERPEDLSSDTGIIYFALG